MLARLAEPVRHPPQLCRPTNGAVLGRPMNQTRARLVLFGIRVHHLP
jgi:hypothetical protein